MSERSLKACWFTTSPTEKVEEPAPDSYLSSLAPLSVTAVYNMYCFTCYWRISAVCFKCLKCTVALSSRNTPQWLIGKMLTFPFLTNTEVQQTLSDDLGFTSSSWPLKIFLKNKPSGP